jgi:hypothetical protein
MLSKNWKAYSEDDQIFYQDETGWFREIVPMAGTSLMGYISASLSELILLFGQPEGACDKTEHQWVLANRGGPGFYVTIYNYKATRSYDDSTDSLGNYIYPSKMAWEKRFKEKRYRWHVGARTQDIADSAITYVQLQLDSIRDDMQPKQVVKVASDGKNLVRVDED